MENQFEKQIKDIKDDVLKTQSLTYGKYDNSIVPITDNILIDDSKIVDINIEDLLVKIKNKLLLFKFTELMIDECLKYDDKDMLFKFSAHLEFTCNVEDVINNKF